MVMKDAFLPSDQDWFSTRFRRAAKNRWRSLCSQELASLLPMSVPRVAAAATEGGRPNNQPLMHHRQGRVGATSHHTHNHMYTINYKSTTQKSWVKGF